MIRNIDRRTLLKHSAGMAGLAALPALLVPRISFAAGASGDARLVVVLLRGALDGLAAAPPVGNPAYARARGEMSLAAAAGLTRLDDLRQWQVDVLGDALLSALA